MNNTITLIGRVAQTPVFKSFQEKDTRVAEFSLAVKDYSKKGEKDNAIFFDIKAFNANSDRVKEYVTKGREVAIHGRVMVEQYIRKDGTSVIKYVVILTGFHLCSGGKQQADTTEATAEGEAAIMTEAEEEAAA
jgi:single-strand DNA-binding protein